MNFNRPVRSSVFAACLLLAVVGGSVSGHAEAPAPAAPPATEMPAAGGSPAPAAPTGPAPAAAPAPGGPSPAGTPPGGSPAAAGGPAPHDSAPALSAAVLPVPGRGTLHLSATLTGDQPVLRSGVEWSVFADAPGPDGARKLVARSSEAQPAFTLAPGRYIVHAAYGFASSMKRVDIVARDASERLGLNAGALEVTGTLGGAPIPPEKLTLSIYVPEHNNPEARIVVSDARPGRLIRLPEGTYHVVSTYLDTVGVGSLTPVSKTNSVVTADLKVQAGKLVQVTLRHRAATLTLKLVNAAGGEALANTSFTILTPGGDVIRELIGAFPSLVLAEGGYVAIARHAGKPYTSEFKVVSGQDRDVEVIAK